MNNLGQMAGMTRSEIADGDDGHVAAAGRELVLHGAADGIEAAGLLQAGQIQGLALSAGITGHAVVGKVAGSFVDGTGEGDGAIGGSGSGRQQDSTQQHGCSGRRSETDDAIILRQNIHLFFSVGLLFFGVLGEIICDQDLPEEVLDNEEPHKSHQAAYNIGNDDEGFGEGVADNSVGENRTHDYEGQDEEKGTNVFIYTDNTYSESNHHERYKQDQQVIFKHMSPPIGRMY